MKTITLLFIALAAFAEEAKPPQFTEAQKLTIAQAALRASIAEGQARQATDQANQIIAQAKAENEKYAALIAAELAKVKACEGATVDIQQVITCPSPKK